MGRVGKYLDPVKKVLWRLKDGDSGDDVGDDDGYDSDGDGDFFIDEHEEGLSIVQ
jgi:hypothetical protein